MAFGVLHDDDDGDCPDLDARVDEFFKLPDRAKRSMTIRHRLRLRSGIAVDNDEFALDVDVECPFA